MNAYLAAHDAKTPLATLSEPEQHRVLDALAQRIEALVASSSAPSVAAIPSTAAKPPAQTSTWRYDPSRPAVPPDFVGRQRELRELALALDDGRSVSLVGDWRIGKSSLLATWAAAARRRGRVVRELSGEGPESAGLQAFVQAITQAPAPADADGAASALDAWARAQGPLAPWVMVDEAGHLLRTLEVHFWSRVRGMLDRLGWVLATRVPLSEVSPDSPLMNRLTLLRVGLLDAPSAQSLVARGGFDAQRVALMHEWAGSHPFYLQLLGRRLADEPDAGDAIDRFRDEAGLRLSEWFAALSAREQQALCALATAPVAHTPPFTLRLRGLLSDDGLVFGRVLRDWLVQQA